jgi:hypothetical protein
MVDWEKRIRWLCSATFREEQKGWRGWTWKIQKAVCVETQRWLVKSWESFEGKIRIVKYDCIRKAKVFTSQTNLAIKH